MSAVRQRLNNWKVNTKTLPSTLSFIFWDIKVWKIFQFVSGVFCVVRHGECREGRDHQIQTEISILVQSNSSVFLNNRKLSFENSIYFRQKYLSSLHDPADLALSHISYIYTGYIIIPCHPTAGLISEANQPIRSKQSVRSTNQSSSKSSLL